MGRGMGNQMKMGPGVPIDVRPCLASRGTECHFNPKKRLVRVDIGQEA